MAYTQRVLLPEGPTWTVLDRDFAVARPVERYLEHLRLSEHSPNTVKAYAKGLELWWSFLERRGTTWDSVGVTDLAQFMSQLRRGTAGDDVATVATGPPQTDATVALRTRAIMSFYRFHAGHGVTVAAALYEQVQSRHGRYLPFMEHLMRRDGRRATALRVRVATRPVPVLMPDASAALKQAEAQWFQEEARWVGDLRYRLLWSLLEETGLRLGEALSLRHRDWTTGTGTTAQIEVVPRPHPHGLRVKSGHRRVYVGSVMDRLYGDFVWELCEQGADVVLGDWDNAYIFCNMTRGQLFGPLRPESVYRHLRSMKRRVPQLPSELTPHWFRHTHATGLLMAGVPIHVVSRRLGHQHVQTTLNTYAHVTEDAELRASADWQAVTESWGARRDLDA